MILVSTATAYHHDPQAKLDYGWDWTAWLDTAETITTATVTPSGGASPTLTLGTGGQAPGIVTGGKKVTAWVVAATADGSLTCHIVTSAGREDDRTIYLNVRDR